MNDALEFRNLVKGHVAIALAVLLLTGLGAMIYALDVDQEQAAVLLLAIAGIQVFLVIHFLMHLVTEAKPVVAVIAFTAFFVAALLGLSLLTFHDTYEGATHLDAGRNVPVAADGH